MILNRDLNLFASMDLNHIHPHVNVFLVRFRCKNGYLQVTMAASLIVPSEEMDSFH